jgi:hypothetical protein
MKKLLVLFAAACFCLFPVVCLAVNAHPYFYLETYTYATDPNSPGPAPDSICVHTHPGPLPELQCFAPKNTPYSYGIVPLHIGQLDEPISEGWPVPLPPGGGYAGVTYGVAQSGSFVIFLSFVACPGFNQGPGTAPGAIVAGAFTQCHDWYDHPGYCKYLCPDLNATYFDITTNAEEANYAVINCQVSYDNTLIGGRAQWGGTKTVTCMTGPTAVEQTTWGKIKGLYR